jgi:hypothetical protein
MKNKNTEKMNAMGTILRVICIVLSLVIISATGNAENFIEQRRKFRDEIKNKVEKELTDDGQYIAITFKGEENKYDFKVNPEDRERLKNHLKKRLAVSDDKLADKMVNEINKGRYVVYKEYLDDGVNLKVVFLSPKATYWKWLTNSNGIENLFHTYNFSVGLHKPDPNSMMTVLQTEGSFYGISQSVNVPLLFVKNEADRTYSCSIPSQKTMDETLKNMATLKPGREKPEEKFIDSCRTHPFFQQKNSSGENLVTDDDIMDIYNEVVIGIEDECRVRQTDASWKIHEDYPYLVVDYNLKTRINVKAFLPKSLSFLGGALEDFAQSISDEVSVKYLPLSMKNFREHTQEWTKTGGPEE